MKPINAQLNSANAITGIEPLFKLFKSKEVKKVKANWEAPNRAEAVPDSALNGCMANAVDVGNNIPKGSTKKNKGISCRYTETSSSNKISNTNAASVCMEVPSFSMLLGCSFLFRIVEVNKAPTNSPPELSPNIKLNAVLSSPPTSIISTGELEM